MRGVCDPTYIYAHVGTLTLSPTCCMPRYVQNRIYVCILGVVPVPAIPSSGHISAHKSARSVVLPHISGHISAKQGSNHLPGIVLPAAHSQQPCPALHAPLHTIPSHTPGLSVGIAPMQLPVPEPLPEMPSPAVPCMGPQQAFKLPCTASCSERQECHSCAAISTKYSYVQANGATLLSRVLAPWLYHIQ